MSNFQRAVDHVIKEEGAPTNDPRDPGGVTKYGISQKAFPTLNIMELTRADAERLYKQLYWDHFPMDQIPDDVAFCLFDTAVNCGNSRAAKLLQLACGVVVDGAVGPRTISAANRTGIAALLCDARRDFYKSLSTFNVYGKGWLARVNRVEDVA